MALKGDKEAKRRRRVVKGQWEVIKGDKERRGVLKCSGEALMGDEEALNGDGKALKVYWGGIKR